MPAKKVLIVSSLFPPDILGGAEQIAGNYARMCQDHGFDVGVFTTAQAKAHEMTDARVDGLRMWKTYMPRPYAMLRFPQSKAWQKPIWHLQDHFDPRNIAALDHVLEAFAPDLVVVHLLQGIGFNGLRAFGARNLPVIMVLHDQGLVCLRANMFKNGHPCQTQCGDCKVSGDYKVSLLKSIKSLAFCSPSRANLAVVSRYAPIDDYPCAVILNPERYPAATKAWMPSDTLRLLFVGRLHKAKGISLLLEAVQSLAPRYKLALTVIGSGQEEEALHAIWGDKGWCRFTGFVSHAEISNYMAESDLLCVSSIWPENSPGVIVHALSLGLPVMGSDKGGIPELVEDGVTGELVEAGNLTAWTRALERLLQEPSRAKAWRTQAQKTSGEVSPESIEQQHIDFIHSRLPLETP